MSFKKKAEPSVEPLLIQSIDGPFVRDSKNKRPAGACPEVLHLFKVLENQNHHRVYVSFRSTGEDECANPFLLHCLPLVLFAFNIVILSNEVPAQLAQFREDCEVIGTAGKYFRNIRYGFTELLEGSDNCWTDVLVEEKRQLEGSYAAARISSN